MSENTDMNLVAVVVTFNRFAQIRTTVTRLLEEPCNSVIVVDNGSVDGTRDWLLSQNDPRLRVVLSETNVGGAGGFARGMQLAVSECDADWVVVMDDDGRPEPGALAAFKDMDLTEWQGAAAAVYYPDGQICDMNRPTVNPFWHLGTFFKTLFTIGGRDAFHLVPEDYNRDIPKQIDITSFVGFFVSRQGIEMAGFPDPRLFIYGDDGLYTIGLRQEGGKIGFFPTVRFEHDCSTFTSAGEFTPIWKAYYYHRNLLFLYKAAAGWLFWPALLLVLPKWGLKGLRQGENKRAYFRYLSWAVSDGLRGKMDRNVIEP
ncbi:MAG: glycosyltransferase [Pseudoruegeria sp.]